MINENDIYRRVCFKAFAQGYLFQVFADDRKEYCEIECIDATEHPIAQPLRMTNETTATALAEECVKRIEHGIPIHRVWAFAVRRAEENMLDEMAMWVPPIEE